MTLSNTRDQETRKDLESESGWWGWHGQMVGWCGVMGRDCYAGWTCIMDFNEKYEMKYSEQPI